MTKKLCVLAETRFHHVSVAEHHAKRAHGRSHWPGLGIDAMRIHAERTAHAEDVDRLHGLHRKAFLVKKLLKLPPADSALNVHGLVLLVQGDAIEISEVKHDPAMRERLPAHSVLLACACDFQIRLPGKRQRVANIVFTRDLDDAVDRRLVQVAGVIDETAALLEIDPRRNRIKHLNGRLFLIGGRREGEVTLFWFVRRRRVIEYLLRAQEGCGQQNNREQPLPLAAQASSSAALVAKSQTNGLYA